MGDTQTAVLEKFLSSLFSWKFEAFAPGYLMSLPATAESVGIMQSDKVHAGGTPNVSIRVDDMDGILAKAVGLGGKIVVPKTPMGEGSFAFVAAPDGNLIGLQKL